MQSVLDSTHEIHFEAIAQAVLKQSLAKANYSRVFILVDSNTKLHCLPVFEQLNDYPIDGIITIKAGEVHKTIETCSEVWKALAEMGADRKSLLINIGGGVVTDLGGFVACTYKRGIDFINIPTTLLAMVDASIGGKTGVDFGSLKNQIGIIRQPEKVLIFPEFLKTLDKRELKSGFAEMLKHGLIADADYWNALAPGKLDLDDSDPIRKSVQIKGDIVAKDPTEQHIRKALNFGHTLGHAIESFFLETPQKETLLHGEAIAIGMVLEGFLSHQLSGLSKVEMDEIKRVFHEHYNNIEFTNEDISSIIELLRHDKKNTHGNINFVLLGNIGKPVLDVKVPGNLLQESFLYYMDK